MNSQFVHNANCPKNSSGLFKIFILATLLLGFNFLAIAGGEKKKGNPIPPPVVNLVVNTPLCFSAMDGVNGFDEDGSVNGSVTMSSLTIQAGGSISNDDPFLLNLCNPVNNPGADAGNITIIVTGNAAIQAGGSIHADNTTAAGNGGNISLTVGGNFTMTGGLISSTTAATTGTQLGGDITINVTGNAVLQDAATIQSLSAKGDAGNIVITVTGSFDMQGSPGATIKAKNTGGGGDGGDITIHVTGPIDIDPTSFVDAGADSGMGGTIDIVGGNSVHIDGWVLSETGGSTGAGCNHAHGGWISIKAATDLFISDQGKISSKGSDPGADLVHLCGCNVTIYGLVQSTGSGHAIPKDATNSPGSGCNEFTHVRPPYRADKPANSTAGVEIWACESLIIDNTGSHNGEINADLGTSGGSQGTSWIDIFVKTGDIQLIGGIADADEFLVHANGENGINDDGGTVTIKALAGKIIASGKTSSSNGNEVGGVTVIEAKGNVDLTGSINESTGSNSSASHGGRIDIRSFGTGPATGSIISGAGSLLDVSGGTPPDGIINLKACGTIGFPAGTWAPDPPVVPTRTTGVCGGTPLLPLEVVSGDLKTYVEFCCCTCHNGKITITKQVFGTPPAGPWVFTLQPGGQTINIPATGGSASFTGLADGNYTVTETVQTFICPEDPTKTGTYGVTNTCGNFNGGLEGHFTITNCNELACTFQNRAQGCSLTGCQWCNKGAVLSQVWQNPGCDNPNNKCVVPDVLVDVDMAHGGANDVVDATEVRTSAPATWSIQAAVDFVTNPANLALFPSPCGELFIGVVGQDPVPVNPVDENSCGHSCAYPLSGDTPYGLENVVVNNTTTRRLNIFGCSVTMRPLDPTKPVFKVLRNSIPGAGKVTILDLHVYTTTKVAGVAGYLVQGSSPTNGGRFTLKNARARGFDIGYDIQVDNVEVTGSGEISGGSYGIKITGNNNSLRTNNQIWDNSVAGIKVQGNGNELDGQDVGAPGHPNAVGIQINGNSNNIHDNDVYSNTGDGLNLSGNSNMIKGNTFGDKNKGNGGDGAEVAGTSNTLDGNDLLSNNGNGIYISAGAGNVVKGNLAGDKEKGNKKNGILYNGSGNGTVSPIEIENNTTKGNGTAGNAADGKGVWVTNTGNQLKGNQSGGSGTDNNVHYEFCVVAANFNATGNKANGVTIAGANGTAFPVACQGSARGTQTPDDLRMITEFKVFPNPGKGRMTVEFVSATTSDYTINVLDIAGRKVMTISYLAQQGANTFDLDISKVSGGVYMMSVQNGLEKFLKKIVVQ